MTHPTLHRAIYFSRATHAVTAALVADILETARINNARDGVTGVLIFNDGRFVQILEGAPSTLDRLLDTIQADPRHTDMDVMARDPIETRDFPQWDMAYLGPTTDLATGAGLASLDAVMDGLRSDDDFIAAFVSGCRDLLAGS